MRRGKVLLEGAFDLIMWGADVWADESGDGVGWAVAVLAEQGDGVADDACLKAAPACMDGGHHGGGAWLIEQDGDTIGCFDDQPEAGRGGEKGVGVGSFGWARHQRGGGAVHLMHGGRWADMFGKLVEGQGGGAPVHLNA